MARAKKVGDVLKVPLGDGWHAYAHVSSHGQVVFYDFRSRQDLGVDDIVALAVAFRVVVYAHTLRGDRWLKIGHRSLAPELLEEPLKFKQDLISGRLSVYHRAFADTNYERPAKLSECRGLERAAVWDAGQVEDRLRDHFNGVENVWLKSMAINKAKVPPDQR